MSDEIGTAAACVRVCSVDDLQVGEARRFDLEDLRVAVVRGEDEWFAIDDECSHADYSLAEGEVDLEDCTLECWKHGSLFSLKTGVPETLPATRPVAVYTVSVADGEVSINLPQPGDSESTPAANETSEEA